MSETHPAINHDYQKTKRLHEVTANILRIAGTRSKNGVADTYETEIPGLSSLRTEIAQHFSPEACDEGFFPTKTLVQIAKRRSGHITPQSSTRSVLSISIVHHEIADMPRVFRLSYGSALLTNFTANLHRSLDGKVNNEAEFPHPENGITQPQADTRLELAVQSQLPDFLYRPNWFGEGHTGFNVVEPYEAVGLLVLLNTVQTSVGG